MIYVNLIESVRKTKNQVQIIATVQKEDGSTFLGITDFFLQAQESLIEDEDDLAYFLEDMDLNWNLYIPH